MLPRGGGTFLNEVDGNLVVLGESGSLAVELSWHGKFRGVDFPPIAFQLVPGKSERLKDSKGRPIWSVSARAITSEEHNALDAKARSKEDSVLCLMSEKPGLSVREIATQLSWFYQNNEPNKSLVDRTMRKLKEQKLVEGGRGDSWTLTKKGEAAAAEIKAKLANLPF